MRITLEQVIDTAGCEVLVCPPDTQAILTTLAWDSRLAGPGSLFVAIKGEKVDGNDFICQVIAAGAGAVIASAALSSEAVQAASQHGALLLRAPNDDPIQALLALAGTRRQSLVATVVGITGSTGKTTTKDLVSAVTARAFKTQATRGNRNTEIGLAEVLLEATEADEVIVCEMGMQALGEIERLCQAAQPHIGVITNIGVAHCELLGSRENIARAKAELLENLQDKSGIAILPGDDAFTPMLRSLAALDERQVCVVTYGLGEQNDIRATNICYDEMGRPGFDVWTLDGLCFQVQLGLQGEHNILNALAAIAVGQRLGVSTTDIVKALAEASPAAMRQELMETPAGDIILNDTYNANPDSMKAALALLKRLEPARRHIAVLGDMYELGPEEVNFHRQIGEFAFVNGVDELITVGQLGQEIAAGAVAVGMATQRVHSCLDVSEALAELRASIASAADAGSAGAADPDAAADPAGAAGPAGSCIILVKASRGMQLERIAEALAKHDADEDTR